VGGYGWTVPPGDAVTAVSVEGVLCKASSPRDPEPGMSSPKILLANFPLRDNRRSAPSENSVRKWSLDGVVWRGALRGVDGEERLGG
jgi:hypothetical protein